LNKSKQKIFTITTNNFISWHYNCISYICH